MSDTVRVTEVLKKKLSSVPEVARGELTTEDMLIGLKSDDNKKTVQIPVSVLFNLIDDNLLAEIKESLVETNARLGTTIERLERLEEK